MLIIVFHLFELFVKMSFADTCEQKFKPIDNICQTINKTTSLEHSSQTCKLPDSIQFSQNPMHVQPHAHKRGPGGKYEGVTVQGFKEEAREKSQEFTKFFKDHYPKVDGKEIDLSFWSRLKIDSPQNFKAVIDPIKTLKEKEYPLHGFIFIVLADHSIRIAPRTILNRKDTGESKHIALAQADDLVAAGELNIEFAENQPKKIQFNLSSGTYMASLDSMNQYIVCEKLMDLLQKTTGLPTEFEENL